MPLPPSMIASIASPLPLTWWMGLAALMCLLTGCQPAAPGGNGLSFTPIAGLGADAAGRPQLRVRVPLKSPSDRRVLTLPATWSEAVVYFDSPTARVAPHALTIARAAFSTVPGGTITTVVGDGIEGPEGDGGPGSAARLFNTHGLCVDAAGNIYLADTDNHKIRKLDAATGLITTVVGTGADGFSGDGGLATAAEISFPANVAIDASGNLYVSDAGNFRIRKVSAATGLITTIAGSGADTNAGDGGSALAAGIRSPSGIAVDATGNVYVASYVSHRVRRIDAATGIITKTAGGNGAGSAGDGALATAAQLNNPDGIAVDAAGNVYIAEETGHRVRKVTVSTGLISTFAGTGISGYDPADDGGPATAAKLTQPHGLDVDAVGNVYITEIGGDVVRKVDATTGLITNVAGGNGYDFTGDGGPATAAALKGPSDVAVDRDGNLYITDEDNERVRMVSGGYMEFVATAGSTPAMPVLRPATDYVVSVDVRTAGTPASLEAIGYVGGQTLQAGANTLQIPMINHLNVTHYGGIQGLRDGGTGAAAFLSGPEGVAVNAAGTIVYIADTDNNCIRQLDLATGTVTTLAGTGLGGIVNGVATAARFNSPRGVALNAAGTKLYVADTGNNRVRLIDLTLAPTHGSFVTTIAGGSGGDPFRDDPTGTNARLDAPDSIVVDAAGDLYVSEESNECIRKIAGTAPHAVTRVAGTVALNGSGELEGVSGFADGPALTAMFDDPAGLALDGAGKLYVADTENERVRVIDLGAGTVSTLAGNGTGGSTDGTGTAARFRKLQGLVFDGTNLFATDQSTSDRIRQITPAGVVTTVVGATTNGFADGTGTSGPKFNMIAGLCVQPGGDFFVADSANHAVRRVTRATGVVTTPAGSIAAGVGNGAVAAATFRRAGDMAIDSAGATLYLSDTISHVIRRVDLATGTVSTLAGTGTARWLDGPAASAAFNVPAGMALHPDGTTLYVADYANQRIRAIDLATNTVSTYAGTGSWGQANGPRLSATFAYPRSVAVGSDGSVYVADGDNHCIRKIDPGGTVSTLAGSVKDAPFDTPGDLVFDPSGRLVVVEHYGHRVHRVNVGTGAVTLLAGNGNSSYVDGPGATASFDEPRTIAVDAGGNVYVVDRANHRIRKIAPDGYVTTVAGAGSGYAQGFRTAGRFCRPEAVVVDPQGGLYVADGDNHALRQIK